MFGIMPGLSLILLQRQPMNYFKADDPREAIVVLIGLGAVIAIGILIKFIRSGISPSVAAAPGSARTQLSPRKFTAFTMYRIASEYGLDREQARLLEYVFRNDSVSNPERVMKNTVLMDRHFRRAYRTIEKNSKTEDDAQERLAKLFSLRNIIEVSAGSEESSPPRLSENTPAVLNIEKDNYPVKVISSRGRTVITEIPRNSLGTPVRLGRGASVTLSFFTKSSDGFSLSGQIAGSLDTDRGTGLQINHTGKLKPLIKRMYRRKQVDMKCEMYPVNFIDTGIKKRPPKMIVDTRKFTGSILDISAGGCALKTPAAIPVGSRLKISIDYSDDHYIHILGQVLRTNRSGAAGTILHIKFLKVPRRAFNSISAMVYEYDAV